MKVLGIIPARGGSKGVKDKNIRCIAGQPLIHYAIEACKLSKKLSKFIVSTDSTIIKELVEKTGTQVIVRPPELSTDSSSVVDAALHALASIEGQGNLFDAIMLIQPTSPIRTGEDLDSAISLLESSPEIEGVISLTRVEDSHPARMYKLEENGVITSLSLQYENSRRQDLPPIYHRNGAIYLVRRNQLFENRTFMPQKKAGLVMNSDYMINIDTEQDVLIAEVILREWKKNSPKI